MPNATHSGSRLAPPVYCIVAYIPLPVPTAPVRNPLAPSVVTRWRSALHWTCNAPFGANGAHAGPFHTSLIGSPPTHFLSIPCAGQSCWFSGPLMNAPCSYATSTTTHPTTVSCLRRPKASVPYKEPPFSSSWSTRPPFPFQFPFLYYSVLFISQLPTVSPFNVRYCVLLSPPLCFSHKRPCLRAPNMNLCILSFPSC